VYGVWGNISVALGLLLFAGIPAVVNSTPAKSTVVQRLERPDQVPDGLSSSDWGSIRARLETARYAIRPVAGSAPGHYRAWNRPQRLRAEFGTNGVFLIRNGQPGQPAVCGRLVFQSYGYGQTLKTAANPTLSVAGNRIEYHRGPLTEWYVNDRRGVEQGFTLKQRPKKSMNAGPLCLEMTLDGELTGELSQDAKTVLLRDKSGVVRMRYTELKAWDARQRGLPARLQTAGSIVQLVVDDRDALYPLTIDPVIITEFKQLTASDGKDEDSFGSSVSISGDTVVVGAPWALNLIGAAYIFDRNNGGANNWGQVKELTIAITVINLYFGWSVSISGDTVVVGNVATFTPGTAYIFDRNKGGPNNWGQVKELTRGVVGDSFGTSVSISGDTVAVAGSGYTYVFDRNNGGADNWGLVKQLPPSSVCSAAISGDTVVAITCFGGSPGAAYIYDRNNGGANNWGQVQQLVFPLPATSDTSVAISGDTVVIGNAGTFIQGAAYVFDRNNGGANNWGQVQKLTASDGAVGDGFGGSVSISEDTVMVGAVNQQLTGAAYVFERNSGGPNNWGQVEKLSDNVAGDFFGGSVSIGGSTVVVGAEDWGSATAETGAAYVSTITTTTLDSASVQYSDMVTLHATVSPNTASGSVQFQINGNNVGSPVSLSGGVAELTTQILQKPDSWGITAQFSSTDPEFQNSQGTATLTVTVEDAKVAPDLNNPSAAKVNTAGGTAGPIVLKASITELQNGPGQVTGTTEALGNICLATPVTVTLAPLVGGGTLTVPAAAVLSCDGTTLVVQGTFNNVPVNVYQVSYTIGGSYYTGTGTSLLAVYDPSQGFVTGGGVINRGGGVSGNFGATAKYVGKTAVQGSVLYIEHRPTGDVRVKSSAMQTLSVVGNTGIIIAKATVNGVGNYTIQAVLVDNGEPGAGADLFGLKVVDPTGAMVPGLTFNPLALVGGNIQVPHKSGLPMFQASQETLQKSQ
jgi:hypothetical protein